MRLWDILLSVDDKNEFIYFVILGVLSLLKSKIIKSNEFSEVMTLFKNVRALDIESVIIEAKRV